MDTLHFAYPWLLPYLFGGLAAAVIIAFFLKRQVRYRYALARTLQTAGHTVRVPARHILFFIRLVMLTILAVLVARPQWLDSQHNVNVKGVDIMLTLDISGSMEFFDDLNDRTPRIEAARKEALDFIERRTNDPIGVVLFGAQALSKVPLTLDKQLLKEVVREVQIGDVDPDGTMMMTALASAISRLRDSTAKSKIVVLLTDGVPSADEKITDTTVIDLAQQFGIKLYTLGVGRADMAYGYDAFGNIGQVPSQIDDALLRKLATQTGGKYYRIYSPADLKNAYDDIDRLEKTEYNTTLFQNRIEAFAWFIWWVVLLFALELFLKMIWWRGLT